MQKMTYHTLVGVLALTSMAAGDRATKNCIQLEVPISVGATINYYNMPSVDSNIDAVDWALNVTTWSNMNFEERITEHKFINCTFKIHAQLCVPFEKGAKSEILQIATQGRGFDKRYWDAEVQPEKYSYLDAAIKKGYSVLTYDQLGSGQSEKPNAYELVQIPVHVEILAALTRLARRGKLISSSRVLSPKSTISGFKPSKVVHVGHSLGSFVTAGMLQKYGELSNGALLTGFLVNSKLRTIDVAHFDHEFAPEQDPVRFGQYTSGYIVLTIKSAIQKLFFRKGGFEPALLDYTEKIKQPEAVGDYASSDTAPFLPATKFVGPIQFFVGEFDYPGCAGDCKNTYLKNQTCDLYPHATNISAVLQPNTGHLLTLATNASAGYEVMLQYLAWNKL